MATLGLQAGRHHDDLTVHDGPRLAVATDERRRDAVLTAGDSGKGDRSQRGALSPSSGTSRRR